MDARRNRAIDASVAALRMTADHRRRAASVVLGLAAVATLLSVYAFLTGGFRVHVFGLPISARGGHRAALFAGVLATIGFVLLDRGGRMTRGAASMLTAQLERLWRLLPAARFLVPFIPIAAAAVVVYLGVQFGTRTAGGSDTYGYVSQARLWLTGELHVTRTELSDAPWPDADWTLTPLGYRPSGPRTIVPAYPPGLPLLMAAFEVALGACGPFLVNPICAGLLVWLTYLLGLRVSGLAAGVLASLCIAVSPIVLMFAVSPLSDLPAATFWTASVVLACSRGRTAAAASGAAAGLAILIRPNLAPLAVVAALFAAAFRLRDRQVGSRGAVRTAATGAALFAAACAPAALFVGWLFNELYGSPLESGYGPTSGLYSWSHLLANGISYPKRLLDVQGPVVYLFLLAPFVASPSRRVPRGTHWLLVGFIAAVFGAYAFYLPFEEWWYLRFLLPAFPPIFVLAFDAIESLRDRIGSAAGAAVGVVLTGALLYQGAALSMERDIIRVAEGEQKYADAGRYVAARLPANSIVLAMQHSGSVRLYSGRLTLRYDLLDPAWLDRSLEYLRRQGYEPYLLLEDWEVDRFKERFAGQAGVALVDAPPIASLPRGNVLLFAGVPGHRAKPAVMPPTSGCHTAQ